MHAEGNKAVCRLFLNAVFNDGQLSSIGDFVAADAVTNELEALGGGTPPPGRSLEWLADLVCLYRHAFPDLRVEIVSQVAERDRVVTCLRMRGTQNGRLMGIQPSGRKLDVAGIRIDRLANGKIAESWFHLDSLAMLRQLGALPEICRGPQPAPRPEPELVARIPLAEMAVWAPGEVGELALAS
jgi:hypothetical protein